MSATLRIDFAARRRLTPTTGAACLLAAAACAMAFMAYQSEANRVEDLEQQVEAAKHRLARHGQQPGNPAAERFTASRLAAINRAITQLNLPWPQLFDVFETTALPNVALLGLEPDSRQGLVRVRAEAKGPDDMADFLATLAAEPRLAEVVLSKYEINEQDKNRPVRFVLQARWKPQQ